MKLDKRYLVSIIITVVIIIQLIVLALIAKNKPYCQECTDFYKPECICQECVDCGDDPDCDPCPKQPTCVDNCTQCVNEVCEVKFVSGSFSAQPIQLSGGGYLNMVSTSKGWAINPVEDKQNAQLWSYSSIDRKFYNNTLQKYVRWYGYPPNQIEWTFYITLGDEPMPAGDLIDEFVFDGYNFYLAHYFTETHRYMLSYCINTSSSPEIKSLTIAEVPNAVVGKETLPSFRFV